MLLSFDITSIISAFVLSFYTFRYKQTFYGKIIIDLGINHMLSLLAVTIVWVYIFKEKGLYKTMLYTKLTKQMVLVVRAVTLGTLLFLVCSYMIKSPYFIERRDLLFFAWLYSICFVILARSVLSFLFMRYVSRKGFDKKRAIILGAGHNGLNLAQRLVQDKRAGYTVVGFLDDNPALQGKEFFDVKVLGKISDLKEIVHLKRVQEVMIAMTDITHKKTLDLISQCKKLKRNVKLVSDLFSVLTEKVTVESLAGIPLIGIKESSLQGVNRLLKRFLDIVGSGVLLVLLSPFFAVIGVIIKLSSKGPVLYKQKRIGRNMKVFKLYKFRSMKNNCNENRHQEYIKNYINGNAQVKRDKKSGKTVHKLTDDSRVTPFGKIMRKTSIDELPQLINIFRGEMSLVGPRPPIPYEVEMYDDWHTRRLDVAPGMTGLWQISGRSYTDFKEMVILDIYYIENWSLWLDIQILARTVPSMLTETSGY